MNNYGSGGMIDIRQFAFFTIAFNQDNTVLAVNTRNDYNNIQYLSFNSIFTTANTFYIGNGTYKLGSGPQSSNSKNIILITIM